MPQPYGEDSVSSPVAGRWLVSCPHPKSWTARSAATRLSAEFPGTAVRWDGAVYEVVSVSTADSGFTVYTLVVWPEAQAIRRLEPYDAESEAVRRADRSKEIERRRKRRLLLALSPLAGHLPASVQERWEREYDVAAGWMTIASAVPPFLYGVFCALSLTIGGFTGLNVFSIPLPLELLGMYLLVESGLRISIAWSGSQCSGSLIGALADRAWRMIRRP